MAVNEATPEDDIVMNYLGSHLDHLKSTFGETYGYALVIVPRDNPQAAICMGSIKPRDLAATLMTLEDPDALHGKRDAAGVVQLHRRGTGGIQ